ncbi:MAG: DEAD/DEAH box helicase [Roseinatronobacter sp.]
MIPTLTDALAERGYETLTDVQQAVTAPDLAGADLLVSAQTGSGKTVGFGLAIAGTLLGDAESFGPPGLPLALVIAPTRELALQVQRELAWLYARTGAQVISCIGGMDPREERRALERGAHIVVGTPGRLRDHIMRGAFDLSDLRAVVLDEADEMLDLGFREDLEFMLAEAPEDKRTLLFSATVPPAIVEIAKNYQRDAVRVTTISRGVQHSDIAYQVVKVAAHDAEHAIINLLRFHDAPTSIVFANTRATVARLAARFANRGLSVVSLSGELSQDERSHALQSMRDGRARVCVATDVAARGIDLPNLDLVIHADLPMNTEALLHRSGRTGRAGRKGVSVLIAPDRAVPKAQRLLKWAKITADWVAPPTPEEILALDEQRLRAAPVWEGDLTADELRFAAELLAERGAEAVATACLRLYRAGLSAPEDVGFEPVREIGRERGERGARPERGARAERPAPAERADFGASAWFELSVGEAQRAEARWLLPMLCRAGGLDKGQIGRIRVEPERTLVEIAETAADGLQGRIGADGLLEENISARRLDAAPDLAAPRERRQDPRSETARPMRKPGRPDSGFSSRPRPSEAPKGPQKAPFKARHGDARSEPRSVQDGPPARKPRHDKRDNARRDPAGPEGGPRAAPARSWDRPDRARDTGDLPRPKPRPKPGADAGPPRNRAGAEGRIAAARSADARVSEARRPEAHRPEARGPEAARYRPGAADASQRMDRPGGKAGVKAGAKSGGKPGPKLGAKFGAKGAKGKPVGARPAFGKPGALKPRLGNGGTGGSGTGGSGTGGSGKGGGQPPRRKD